MEVMTHFRILLLKWRQRENKSDTKKETKYIKELVFRDTSIHGRSLLKQEFFSAENGRISKLW
jgi:hypothetical protein